MIKISADSTCDLSPELKKKLDVAIVPLSIVAGDDMFRDGIDIYPEDVFRFGEEGIACQTGAVNVFEYQRHFQKLTSGSKAVFHISLGSGFSSCHSNALLAARDFSNVHVIDSKNLTTGSGLLVYDVALLAAEGLEPLEIKKRLEDNVAKGEVSFVIDQLDYLARGGRCSAITAQGAKVLRLKPCIEVRDGAMIVGRKYRGTFEKVVTSYVKERLQDRTDIDFSRVFVTQAGCEPELVNGVVALVEELANFKEVLVTEAGCTISSHCGPNTLGIVFRQK